MSVLKQALKIAYESKAFWLLLLLHTLFFGAYVLIGHSFVAELLYVFVSPLIFLGVVQIAEEYYVHERILGLGDIRRIILTALQKVKQAILLTLIWGFVFVSTLFLLLVFTASRSGGKTVGLYFFEMVPWLLIVVNPLYFMTIIAVEVESRCSVLKCLGSAARVCSRKILPVMGLNIFYFAVVIIFFNLALWFFVPGGNFDINYLTILRSLYEQSRFNYLLSVLIGSIVFVGMFLPYTKIYLDLK